MIEVTKLAKRNADGELTGYKLKVVADIENWITVVDWMKSIEIDTRWGSDVDIFQEQLEHAIKGDPVG